MSTEERNDKQSEQGINADNPWPGLASFTEKDREFFYGRDEEKDDLFRRVVRQSLTVLFGQSGLGKSSLLRAGLFPELRQAGYLPVPIRLDHSPSQVSLAAQVILAADRAIVSAGGKVEAHRADEQDSIWKYFHRRSFVPTDAQGKPLRLVLVLDQFEELFAAGQANEAARRRASDFINQFADLIENRVPLVLEEQMESQPELARLYDMQEQDHRYLICLREDYLPQLESLRRVIPSLGENRLRLTRMNGVNALEAVLKPGRNLLTEAVATRIVRFVSGGKVRQLDGSILQESDVLAGLEIEPSLLSLVCRELNSQRQANDLPQITVDLLAGNQNRILLDFYERCVADMPAALREFVEDELVTESGLRENIALERIQSYLKEHDVAPASIDELISRRLLHAEERLDVRRIELTHDVLTSVVKQSRDERRAREATKRAEQEAAELLARARQQRRRLSLIVGGMAVSLAIVSVFGFSSYRLYRISQDRLIEVEAQKKRAEEGELSAAKAKIKAEAVKEVFDEATLPVTVENAAHIPGLGPVQEALAQLRIKSLERLAAKTPDDESIPVELAEAFAVSGVIRTYVGSFKAAESDLRKSIDLYQQLRQKKPAALELRRAEFQATNELGYLFKEDSRPATARKIFQSLISQLKDELTRHPEDEAFQFELLLAMCRLTGVYAPNMTNEEKTQNLPAMFALLETLERKKYRLGELTRLRTVVTYNEAMLRGSEATYEQRLADIEKFKELDDAALSYFPRSPMIRTYRSQDLDDQADLMKELGRLSEGIKLRELALAEARAICQSSPNVYRYEAMLSKMLMNLADDYRLAYRRFEADSLMDESTKIVENLRQQFADRGDAAAAWIKQKIRQANWYIVGEYQDDQLVGKQRYQELVLQAIQPCRKLAEELPDHYNTQVEFTILLGMVARIKSDEKNHQDAFQFYQEAIDVLATRCFSGDEQDIQTTDIVNFLDYVGSAAEAALEFEGNEELTTLLTTLEGLKLSFENPSAIYNYGRTLNAVARWKYDQKEYDEVVRWTKKSIELQSDAFAAAPWHWYLGNDLGRNYRLLGDAYISLKQPKEAIEAYREFAKLILAPRHGVDIAEFLDESLPATEERAEMLQKIIESSMEGAMKRFTVDADFNGTRYPIYVYVTNIPLPKHPLEDQARWLMEERGGTIPTETMDRYKRLQEIAAENKVSFAELCVYALGEVKSVEPEGFEEAEFDDGHRLELEISAIEAVAVDEEEVSAPDKNLFATEFAQVMELKTTFQDNPDDSVVMNLLLSRVDHLGSKLLRARQMKEAINVLEYASSLHGVAIEQSQNDAVKMRNFARSLRDLAAAYFNVGNYEATFRTLQRQHEFLKQVRNFSPDKPQVEADLGESTLVLGEIAELQQTSTEALNWYLQAAALKHPRAYRKISRLLRVNPLLARFLAEPERDLFTELHSDLSSSAKSYLKDFGEKLQKLKAAEMYDVGLTPATTRAELEKKWTDDLPEYVQTEIKSFVTEFERRMIELRDDPLVRSRREALMRGREKYLADDYAGALPDYLEGCQEDDTSGNDLNRLGICLGKAGRWGESIEAYRRSVDRYKFSTEAVAPLLNLFEAFLCNNQPAQLIEYNATLADNEFSISSMESSELAIYHAFVAIAQLQTGVEPQASIEQMRAAREGVRDSKDTWDWTEFDRWLKESDLDEETKKRIQSIIDEIRTKKTES